MLLDGGTPKVSPAALRNAVEDAGISVAERGADIGIVVGGDGRFSRYGRTESVPLLFVGVRSKNPTGSRAFMAEATFDELPEVLPRIKRGDYSVVEHRRLAVSKNGKGLGEVFTDTYMGRGTESTCLRYRLKVRGAGVEVDEAAIADGVVISTSAGSTGYYSYPDRIRGERMDPDSFARIGDDEIGICHVVPTYTERKGSRMHPLRYTVPWGTSIEISLFREADARLYGTGDSREGVRVSMKDKVLVREGRSVTKVVSLRE